MLSEWQKKFFKSGDGPSPEGNQNQTWDHENLTESGSKGPNEVINQEPREELPDKTAQDGVIQAEAITLTWTKTSLGLAYTL
jgi:hypothetical protein